MLKGLSYIHQIKPIKKIFLMKQFELFGPKYPTDFDCQEAGCCVSCHETGFGVRVGDNFYCCNIAVQISYDNDNFELYRNVFLVNKETGERQ